jgi:hypothetical protein
MTTDLYSADLGRISGGELYDAISEFTQINSPCEDRPREGYLLDFKQDLSSRFLHSVAALANSFGGLLILGVSENDGRPEHLVGVVTKGELKTRVASMISSNLIPCPRFDVAECPLPNDETHQKKLCVVRVRTTQEICLLATKGESHPVYVRVEDQSLPADFTQMRTLLSRKRSDQDSRSDLNQRLQDMGNGLLVRLHGEGKDGIKSDTYFKLIICPSEYVSIPLDLSVEKRFFPLITKLSPRLDRLMQLGNAKREFGWSRDWTEVRFVDQAVKYERRWRVSSRADIGFVTQTKWSIAGTTRNYWSLYDVAADTVRTVILAREFWRSISYYGGFRMEAELRVNGLLLEYSPLSYAWMSDTWGFAFDGRSVTLGTNIYGVEKAELEGDFTAFGESLTLTVANVVNQLLRCLGHTSDLASLEKALGFFIGGALARHPEL